MLSCHTHLFTDKIIQSTWHLRAFALLFPKHKNTQEERGKRRTLNICVAFPSVFYPTEVPQRSPSCTQNNLPTHLKHLFFLIEIIQNDTVLCIYLNCFWSTMSLRICFMKIRNFFYWSFLYVTNNWATHGRTWQCISVQWITSEWKEQLLYIFKVWSWVSELVPTSNLVKTQSIIDKVTWESTASKYKLFSKLKIQIVGPKDKTVFIHGTWYQTL